MSYEEIKDIITNFGEDYLLEENINSIKLLTCVADDYNELVQLRNKLEYDINCEQIYQEDVQVLDHALDYFELLIDILNIQRKEEIEKIKKSHKGE